jgi:dolichol-phosphate mannosyltransferase
MTSPSVTVVIPTYREAENLRTLVPDISAVLTGSAIPHEIIVVDDNSSDGTIELLETLRASHPVRLIVRTNERGLSSAVLRGFDEATGDILVCMDGDHSHPPDVLPHLVEAVERHADFVIGSRYVEGGSTQEGWGVFRWLNSRFATLLARPFTRVRDPMSGFFALRRTLYAASRDLNPVGYKIGLELIVKCDPQEVLEIPINFANRKSGESKLNLKEQLAYMRHLQRLFLYKYRTPYQFACYSLVGALGTIVDLGILWVLLAVTHHFPVSRAFSIWVAMTFNFALNRRLTFRGRGYKKSLLAQYWRFCLSCLGGAAVSFGLSNLFYFQVGMFVGRPLVSSLAGVAAGTCFNFFLSRYWVFLPGKAGGTGS